MSTGLRSKTLLICIFLGCVALSNSSLAGGESAAPAAGDLVLRLGAEVFGQRQAAERELAALGMSARNALFDGLQNDDPEIRRACQRVLTGVLEKDFQKRVAAYVADKAGKQDHDLPGWARYRKIVGSDKEARELFVQMLKAEAGLLESVEAGSMDAVKLRLSEVAAMAYNRNTRERKQPPRGTMAALLFACSDSGLAVPEDVMTRANFHSLIGQGEFGVSLQKGPLQRPARAVLSEWIRMPATQKLAPSKLRFAVIYGLTEPGIDLALHALSEKKTALATTVASAAEALGRLGGKPYAALLVDILDDERMCSQQVTIKNGKREMIQIQVRDVALAWLVFATGQDANAYGLSKAARYKDMIKKYPTQAFSFGNFAYDKPDSREKALAKWNAWLKDHALPTPPRTQPQKIERLPDAPPDEVAANLNPENTKPGHTEIQPLQLDMADRLQVRDLIRARKLIEQGTFVEATTMLGEVLAADGDYFYRAAPGVTLFKQLKAEAERLLGELPAKGRAAYELQFGSQARRELDLAVEAGDMQAVAHVDRSFFYTPAGAEATFLLGTYHRIGGRFTQAAMYFERLRNLSPRVEQFEPSLSLQQAHCWYRSGFAGRARNLLTQLLAARPEAGALLAGRANASREEIEEALFGADSAAGIADAPPTEWALFRGNLAGNRIALPGSPYLKTLHAAALTQERYIDDTLERIKKSWTEERRTALPNVHPLIVDGAIVFRTPLAIRAVDLETDELRWEATALNSLWHLVRFGSNTDREGQQSHVADGLRERLSEDPTFGTLSSNGHLVFAVVDAGFSLGPDYRPAIVRGDGQRQVDAGALRGFNRLAAYDVRSGKLVWELGGPPETKGESLTGGRFAGPPLPLGDQLYAVVAFDEQTQLVAIDAETGALQQAWLLDTQFERTMPALFNLGRAFTTTTTRDGGGVSPVFGEGLLVCCTPDNHYVAVDLASRSVRWSFEPPAREGARPRNIFMLQQRQLLNQKLLNQSDRWVEGGALLVDGRALLTPAASDEIFCLNLSDGTLLWSAPREDGFYLAGASADLAVVVGRQSVWARRLTDGKLAWSGKPVSLPQGAAPSGRGYLTKDQLLVPLSSAEVVAIDLADGRIVSNSQSPDGIVPENLVKSGDYVVSVGLSGVRKFETLGARAQRLAAAEPSASPESQSAVDRAELLLYQGQLVEALALLRTIEGAGASPRVVALLGEATVQALRAGVAGAEEIASEVEDSINDPALKGRLLERLATAYDHAGMHRAAFDSCLKLIDSGADGQQLIDVTAAHTVRRSRSGKAEIPGHRGR
jgi:outer membrane protein assembly factor BamB